MIDSKITALLQSVVEEIHLLRLASCAEAHVSPCGLWCWPRPFISSQKSASIEEAFRATLDFEDLTKDKSRNIRKGPAGSSIKQGPRDGPGAFEGRKYTRQEQSDEAGFAPVRLAGVFSAQIVEAQLVWKASGGHEFNPCQKPLPAAVQAGFSQSGQRSESVPTRV